MKDGPRWRRIYRDLDARIRAGEWLPGGRLPAEDALAAAYGVHRHTVRRALARMQEQGRIRAEQGRGTFVQEPVTLHTIGRRSRLSETARSAYQSAARTVLATRRMAADATIAAALGVGFGAPVRRVDTLHFINGAAAALTEHFYPLPRFEGVQDRIAALGSITAALNEYGVSGLLHVASRVSARTPSQRHARLLGQTRSKPVLHVVNLSTDAEGIPVQLTRTLFAAARIELLFRHRLEELAG